MKTLIVFAFISCSALAAQPPRPTELTPGHPWDAYNKNEAAGEAKYKGKLVEVGGRVYLVSKVQKQPGKYWVSFCRGNGPADGVTLCMVDDCKELRMLESGVHIVLIHGVVVAWSAEHRLVHIGDCQIMRIGTERPDGSLQTIWKRK